MNYQTYGPVEGWTLQSHAPALLKGIIIKYLESVKSKAITLGPYNINHSLDGLECGQWLAKSHDNITFFLLFFFFNVYHFNNGVLYCFCCCWKCLLQMKYCSNLQVASNVAEYCFNFMEKKNEIFQTLALWNTSTLSFISVLTRRDVSCTSKGK